MKIVHVARTHRWDDTRIFKKECRSLAKAGHEVYIVTSDRSAKRENEMVDGIKFIVIQTRKGNRVISLFKYISDAMKALKQLDADVYHIHEFFLLILAKKLSYIGKVIFDSHEDFPKQVFFDSSLSDQRNLRREKLARIFMKWNIRYCDRIIAATDEIEKALRVYNIPTCIIYNFPDLSEFNDAIIQEENSHREKKRQICYVGGISEDRGINQTIEALNRVDDEDIRLALAGPITNSYLAALKSKDAWKKVNYYGYADSKMKLEIYGESMLGMITLMPIPRYKVALPVKLFEYMAAGLPVIASDFPIIKKIIDEEESGICVDPENVLEIKKAIQYIANHPEHAQRMGENGKNAVQEKYNWDNEREKLYKLYDGI